MRLLTILSLTAVLSAPAFAADLGTYRPGTPYHSVVAPGADVCDSQCAGDAQCRGWNYVKANPAAPGVCEFISNVSSPVASAISISGVGNASSFGDRVMNGGSNTVRVGTAVAPKPRTNVTRIGNRNVVREAVPSRAQAQAASTRRIVRPTNQPIAGESLTAQQNRYRMHTRDIAPQQSAPQQRQAVAPRQMGQPNFGQQQRPQSRAPQGFRPMLDGSAPVPQQVPQGYARGYQQGQPQQPQAMQQRREPARRRGQSSRPPVGQPIAAPQMPPQAAAPQGQQQQRAPQAPQRPNSHMMPRSSAQAPVTHQNGTAALKQRQAELIAQSRMKTQGLTAEQAQQSLYGSLYDDVKVPAANAPVPNDPNAPIPTANSRPTVPVQVEGLAGAYRR